MVVPHVNLGALAVQLWLGDVPRISEQTEIRETRRQRGRVHDAAALVSANVLEDDGLPDFLRRPGQSMHRRSIVAAVIALVVPVLTILDAAGGGDDNSKNTTKAGAEIAGQDSLRTSSGAGDCLETSVANALVHIRDSGRTSPAAPAPPPPTLTFVPVNAEVRQGGIYVKVSGSDGVEDAGALSGPVMLPAALTMIATERTTYRYVGWQASDRLGRTSDLIAGLAFTNGGAAEVRERGRYLIDVPYHTGDVFTIALTPTWLRYLRNGLEFFSHRVSIPESLRAAIHLLSQGATLGPVCVAR